MSKETLEFLRDNIRYGFTDDRGPTWWADREDDNYMSDGSHFPGEVPEYEVRKLLDVKLVSGPVTTVYTDANGERVPVVDKTRQAIIRVMPESAEVLGIFKAGYQIHEYNEWINDMLRNITDSGLQTACAALLRKGAVAFHQVKLPDVYNVAGFEFTPYFTGATSCDGSLASLWFTGVDAAVCDNTFEMARAGAQTRVTRKHTKNSTAIGQAGKIRDELGLVLKAGEDFTQMAEDMLKVDVSDADFAAWLDEMVPMPEVKVTKGGGPGRGYTMAETKRDELTALTKDPMVAPWWGTKFGIYQLDNTWRTHLRGVHGTNRMERNLINMVTGETFKADQYALDALDRVQARTLVFA